MIALSLALLLSAPSQAQTEVLPPPACVGATFVSWEACAEAAGEGTAGYGLAMINLGTTAYLAGNYAAALDYYDRAVAPGHAIVSDVFFHTFRGDAYHRAGRGEAARSDASIAWGYLIGQPPRQTESRDLRPIDDDIRHFVLSRILPILRTGDADTFNEALALYMGLPASDYASLSDRASVLAELGEPAAALDDSRRALHLAPDEPGVLNNHCFILTETGQPDAGLPYCERAVALAPEIPQIRHSYASALAGRGHCAEAELQLAEARRLAPETALYREALDCTPGS